MGRHSASPKPQELLIWDYLTHQMEKEIAAHPRRYADLKVGTDLVVHDTDVGKVFGGIVIALDPLQITWRY